MIYLSIASATKNAAANNEASVIGRATDVIGRFLEANRSKGNFTGACRRLLRLDTCPLLVFHLFHPLSYTHLSSPPPRSPPSLSHPFFVLVVRLCGFNADNAVSAIYEPESSRIRLRPDDPF